MLTGAPLAWPLAAVAAAAAEVPLRVLVLSDGWGATFTPSELAAALRLRLPGAQVEVAPAAPGQSRERSVWVRWLNEVAGLRVERGDGDAVEFPVTDGGRELPPPQAARRAALLVAIFAEGGEPLGEPAPVTASPPAAAPGAPAPPGAAAPAAGDWALGAQLGPAFTWGDGGISSAIALTLRARRYVSPSAAIELGAKLSDEYETQLASQSAGVADRAFFAGVAYGANVSPRWTIDLDAALQYTHPVVDLDPGPVTQLEAPASSRFAVRVGAGLGWSPANHVTLGLSAASSFSFREREFHDGAGNEVLNLGSLVLDLTAGVSVRW